MDLQDFRSLSVGKIALLTCMQLIVLGCDNNPKTNTNNNANTNTKDAQVSDAENGGVLSRAAKVPEMPDIEYTPAPIDYETFTNYRDANEESASAMTDSNHFSNGSAQHKKHNKQKLSVKPVIAEEHEEYKEIIKGAEVQIRREIE